MIFSPITIIVVIIINVIIFLLLNKVQKLQIRKLGLFEANNTFYFRKICEAIGLLSLAIFLQLQQRYVLSALILGLAWQQLGWLVHEYAHHQHFRVISRTMNSKKIQF